MLGNKTRVSRRGRRRAETPPNPRKEPVQGRSRETVSVVLEAAARILETEGPEGYNTNAIAKRAGVSVGSVYQYFPNKDAVTVALIRKFEGELAEVVRSVVAETRDADLQKTVQTLARAIVAAHARRGALHRYLEIEEERLLGVNEAPPEMQRLVVALLRRYRRELRVAASLTTAEDLITIVRALVDSAFRRGVAASAIEARVRRAVNGYLLFG